MLAPKRPTTAPMKKVVIVTIGMASSPPRSASEKQAAQRTRRGLANARPTATSRWPKNTMVFFGHLLVAVGRAFSNPRRVRWAACFSLAERAGLDAIPIVTITTFFIGAVVGLLGANMLTTFGAQVYVVELIGVAVLREFNVLITALLLAGRSASSFAAEIGSMKMNQEIDAMQIMGVDPFEALVLP